MRAFVFAVALLSSAPAFAQQADIPTLQKAIQVLTNQRNGIMDALANVETRVVILQEENAKLKAEIENLKKTPEK